MTLENLPSDWTYSFRALAVMFFLQKCYYKNRKFINFSNSRLYILNTNRYQKLQKFWITKNAKRCTQTSMRIGTLHISSCFFSDRSAFGKEEIMRMQYTRSHFTFFLFGWLSLCLMSVKLRIWIRFLPRFHMTLQEFTGWLNSQFQGCSFHVFFWKNATIKIINKIEKIYMDSQKSINLFVVHFIQ